MKNIIKVNQGILSTWEQANAHDRAVAVNWEGIKHVGVVTNNGAALIVVPEKLSPFNFDALARRLPAFDMQAILDKLPTSQEEALGELSGMTEKNWRPHPGQNSGRRPLCLARPEAGQMLRALSCV